MATQGYDPIPSHLLDDLSEEDLRELGEDQDEWNALASDIEAGGSPEDDQTPPDGDPDPGDQLDDDGDGTPVAPDSR